MRRLFQFILFVALLALSPQLRAVILLGSGDPALNTTAPSGALADGGWKYVGAFGWSTGTAIGPHHFITAKHVGQPANDIIYQGKSYPIVGSVEDPYSDLRIFKIAGTFPNYASLYSRADERGKNAVIIGRGTQRGTPVLLNGNLRGWQWGPGDTVQRWGQNQIGDATGAFLYASFDGNGGPNECMLSSGDSGGPIFIEDGGVWKLAGINSSISSTIASTATSAQMNAAIFDMRGFYDWNHQLVTGDAPVTSGFFALRMSEKLPWIQSVIAPALANISTRALVGADDKVAIAGFIVEGDAGVTKRILLRGIGPSLGASGIVGRMPDPALELYDGHGVLVFSNNDWRTAQETEIRASGLAPGNDKEAAILATLPPGGYTVALRVANNSTSGVGLVEVYDLDPMGDARLVNLSSRAFIGAGDNVLIGGVTFNSTSDSLLLRAIGPSLIAHGLANAIDDPAIELRDSYGELLVQNNNWRDNANAADIVRSGLAPNDTRESAMLLHPGPGVYTAIVRGANDTVGIGLVEAFLVAL